MSRVGRMWAFGTSELSKDQKQDGRWRPSRLTLLSCLSPVVFFNTCRYWLLLCSREYFFDKRCRFACLMIHCSYFIRQKHINGTHEMAESDSWDPWWKERVSSWVISGCRVRWPVCRHTPTRGWELCRALFSKAPLWVSVSCTDGEFRCVFLMSVSVLCSDSLSVYLCPFSLLSVPCLQ